MSKKKKDDAGVADNDIPVVQDPAMSTTKSNSYSQIPKQRTKDSEPQSSSLIISRNK